MDARGKKRLETVPGVWLSGNSQHLEVRTQGSDPLHQMLLVIDGDDLKVPPARACPQWSILFKAHREFWRLMQGAAGCRDSSPLELLSGYCSGEGAAWQPASRS